MTPLVDELVCVSVEPSLRRHGGLVEMVALVAALAGLDEHHGPVEAFAVGAGEGDAGGACTTGRAAAAVPAHAAVVGPVQASAPAAGVGQAVWFRRLVGTRALSSFLWRENERKNEFSCPVKSVQRESTTMEDCPLFRRPNFPKRQ